MTKKFLGKIRTDPWESLAKGPREVMVSLWQEYLSEALRASPKSRRYATLRREIEEAGGFREIARDWPDLDPEARAERWRRLMNAVRDRVQASRELCVRCGECCEISSPTLLLADLPLLEREVLTWEDVYTLRAGERVTSREGKAETLEEERLKVREVPGAGQCWFYLAATQICRIYDDRPEQCRRQECWAEPGPPPAPEELLHREHLFARVPEVWELVCTHRERCALDRVAQALAEVAEGREDAGDRLFDALHFDHYLRQMFQEEWGLKPGAVELILGRPLKEFLKTQGFIATLTPEGVFRLTPRE